VEQNRFFHPEGNTETSWKKIDMYIHKMGYGFFEPCIVYGFYEKEQNKIICWDFLEEHELHRYIKYTNKGGCFGFVYGISCNSIEEMNTIDKTNVDKVFELLSKKDEYVPPKLMLALRGNLDTSGYSEYYPRG